MRSLLLQSSYVQFVEIICIDIKLVVVLSRFGFIQANTSFVAKAQRTKLSKGFRRFEFLTFVEFPQFPAIFDILESSICISQTFCRSKAEDLKNAEKWEKSSSPNPTVSITIS